MSVAERFLAALTFQLGYNAALVAAGAALLGAAAGAVGTYLFLRRRALVSDAVAHATLPGVALAFIAMVALGGDGRWLPGLLGGAAISATLGLLAVQWLASQTRLPEDAAIAAVLSVFFGFGVVLLTFIQVMPGGRQAGLEGFLLGSTAGMLFSDAIVIAAGGLLAGLAVLAQHRTLVLVAFDADYAAATGVPVGRVDLALLGLVTGVTVIGLKVVGLVLIVALLIIPAVTARLWTDRVDRMAPAAALAGGAAGHVGTALSASAPHLPTGSVIVLCAATLFALSLLAAPQRGLIAGAFRARRYQWQVHRRQGLLALARGEPILDHLTLRVLRGEGLMRPDGAATETGRAVAARALRDEQRWQVARGLRGTPGISLDGLAPIETVLTPDEIAEVDRRLGPPVPAEAR